MIPKPPFSCDFSPERELEKFRRIPPRLAEPWNVLSNREKYGRQSTRAQEEAAEPPAEARSGRHEYRDTIVGPRVWPADS